jgi:hypothetical protein
MTIVVALLLGLVLPALAGAVLLSRDGDHAPGRSEADATPPDLALARAAACGVATWLFGSGLLTRTVGLTATSAWVWDTVVALVSAGVLLLPRHRPRVRRVVAAVGVRLTEVGVLGAVVFLPLWYAIVHTSWSPLGSTPWYYYGLARQVADLGSIPAASAEFGATTPFLNDYHLFTTGTAMLLVQHPGGPIAVVIVVTLISALLLAVGTSALTCALGGGRITGLLAVPIALAAGLGPIRLSGYRPEGFALGLILLMAALAVHWLRSRAWPSLVGAGLVAATLSQVHGIAAVTSGVLVVAAVLVSLLRRPRGEQLRRAGILVVTLLAGVVVAALLFHEASGTSTSGGLVDRGGLDDPTWEFFRAARGDPGSLPPSNGYLVRQSVRELYSWQAWWMIPALLLAGVGLWRSRRETRTRELVAFTLLSLLGILVAASVFMLGWQGYVPRRTGSSRLVLEMSLVGPPLLAIGLERAVALAWPWDRSDGRRRLLGSPAQVRAAAVVLALSIAGLVSMVRVADYDDGQAPTRAQLAVWRSLPVRHSDVVLANGYTEGFIPDVTGGQGLLDGRAPYTFGDQLARANRLFRQAQAFFTDPAGHWDFLAAHDVSWVVVGDADAHSLATGNVWETPESLHGLAACSGLRRVAATTGLTVFRVVDPSPGGCTPPGAAS